MLNLDQSCSKIEEETDEVDNDIHDSVLEISFNNCIIIEDVIGKTSLKSLFY